MSLPVEKIESLGRSVDGIRLTVSSVEREEINQKINNVLINFKKITDEFFNLIVVSLTSFEKLFSTLSPDEKIYLSFNGGKDVLASYILIKYYFYCKINSLDFFLKTSFNLFCKDGSNTELDEKSNGPKKTKSFNIVFVYFVNSQNYQEEEDYVINFAKREGVEIFYLYSDYVTGLKFLIKNFDFRVIVMGTRRDDVILSSRKVDPQIETDLVHPSTDPYPNFTRFYPVFHFDYNDIWRLILNTNFEYLSLYDKGYSSIGKRTNTKINKNLKINDEVVLPAWCLEEYVSERSFRTEN